MSLNTHNVQEYILRKVPNLTPVDEKMTFEMSPTQLVDNNIKSAILQLVPEEVYYIIEALPMAFQMWNSIAAYYQPNSEVYVDGLIKEFWSLNFESGADVDECAIELTKLQSKIASLDPSKRPSDLSKRNRLLDHFETECNGFHNGAVSFMKLNSHVSFLEAVNLIRDSQRNYLKYNEKAVANFANSRKDMTMKICSFCGRNNHTRERALNRWTLQMDRNGPLKTHRKQRQLCHSRRFGGSRSNDKNQPENEYVLSCSTLSSNDVILDTGATHHIFCDSSLFTSMVPVRKSIETASGRVEPVSWSGSVSFEIDYANNKHQTRTVRLSDVWYLPSCAKNLVSGSQLTPKGYKIKTNKYGLEVY